MPKGPQNTKEYNRQYYLENKEKIKARAADRRAGIASYGQSVADKKLVDPLLSKTEKQRLNYYKNRDKIIEASTRYYYANRQRVLDRQAARYHQDREEGCRKVKEWAKANPGSIARSSAKSRATRHRAAPSWLTDAHKSAMKEIYLESERLTHETGQPHHVDHFYPLKGKTVCGLHVPWNLRIILGSENCSKLNRMPEDFYGEEETANILKTLDSEHQSKIDAKKDSSTP